MLFDELRCAGFTMEATGTSLKVRPADKLTEAQRQRIKLGKRFLLDLAKALPPVQKKSEAVKPVVPEPPATGTDDFHEATPIDALNKFADKLTTVGKTTSAEPSPAMAADLERDREEKKLIDFLWDNPLPDGSPPMLVMQTTSGKLQYVKPPWLQGL